MPQRVYLYETNAQGIRISRIREFYLLSPIVFVVLSLSLILRLKKYESTSCTFTYIYMYIYIYRLSMPLFRNYACRRYYRTRLTQLFSNCYT